MLLLHLGDERPDASTKVVGGGLWVPRVAGRSDGGWAVPCTIHDADFDATEVLPGAVGERFCFFLIQQVDGFDTGSSAQRLKFIECLTRAPPMIGVRPGIAHILTALLESVD